MDLNLPILIPQILIAVLMAAFFVGLVLAMLEVISTIGVALFLGFVWFPMQVFKNIYWIVEQLFKGLRKAYQNKKLPRKRKHGR